MGARTSFWRTNKEHVFHEKPSWDFEVGDLPYVCCGSDRHSRLHSHYRTISIAILATVVVPDVRIAISVSVLAATVIAVPVSVAILAVVTISVLAAASVSVLAIRDISIACRVSSVPASITASNSNCEAHQGSAKT